MLANKVPAELVLSGRTYHSWLHPGPGQGIKPGDTAVFFFRPQVFAARHSGIATVTGLRAGRPTVESAHDEVNRPLSP